MHIRAKWNVKFSQHDKIKMPNKSLEKRRENADAFPVSQFHRCGTLKMKNHGMNQRLGGRIMKVDLKKKAFMGIWRFMIPLPLFMIKKDVSTMANAICRKSVDVSDEERKVHYFVVKSLSDTNEPVTPEYIANTLGMPLDRVKAIVDKLEEMKTFFYRYDCPGINWAYPVTAEDSGHKVTFNAGAQLNAA